MSIGLSVAVYIVIMVTLTRRGDQDRYFLVCGHVCVGLGIILSYIFLSSRTFSMVEFIVSFAFLIASFRG